MTSGAAPDFNDDFRRQLAELLAWRRDVRRFRPDPLGPGQLDRLLDLACLAPSVGLSQPWRFVSVDSAAARAGVIAAFEAANAEALGDYGGDRASLYARLKLAGLREAPVHLAVFCDEATGQGHGLGRRTMPEMLAYSTVTAVNTLWLAARAEGIGVGWVSILEPQVVTDLLEVPTDWRLIAYLCIGHPLADQAEPELARAGWQQREPTCREVLTR